jgi:hypothetical protein
MIYVQWSTVVKWKHEMDEARRSGAGVYPYQYASNGPRFRKIKKGDVLWVVANPRFGATGQPDPRGRATPAAVMARLRVRTVCCQAEEGSSACGKELPRCVDILDDHIHPASDVSRGDILVVGEQDEKDAAGLGVTYPPLYNIFGILNKLTFRDALGAPDLKPYIAWVEAGNYWKKGVRAKSGRNSGPHWKLAQRLRTLRKLTPEAGRILDKAHKAAVKGRRVFLSYRHADVRALAAAGSRRSLAQWMGELEQELEDADFVSWLDKHQILGDGAGKGLLNQTLQNGVRQAALFVALITPGYAVPKVRGRNWTLEEWQGAGEQVRNPRRRNELVRIGLLCGGDADLLPTEASDRFLSTEATPRAIARAIAEETAGLGRPVG